MCLPVLLPATPPLLPQDFAPSFASRCSAAWLIASPSAEPAPPRLDQAGKGGAQYKAHDGVAIEVGPAECFALRCAGLTSVSMTYRAFSAAKTRSAAPQVHRWHQTADPHLPPPIATDGPVPQCSQHANLPQRGAAAGTGVCEPCRLAVHTRPPRQAAVERRVKACGPCLCLCPVCVPLTAMSPCEPLNEFCESSGFWRHHPAAADVAVGSRTAAQALPRQPPPLLRAQPGAPQPRNNTSHIVGECVCSCSSSGARRGYSHGINSAEGQIQNWGSGSAQSVAGTEQAKHGKGDCWVIFSGRQTHWGAGGCRTLWAGRSGLVGTGRRCSAGGPPAGAVHSLRGCSRRLEAGCHAACRHQSSPSQPGSQPGRHHTQRLHFLPRPGSCSLYLHPLMGSMLGGSCSI